MQPRMCIAKPKKTSGLWGNGRSYFSCCLECCDEGGPSQEPAVVQVEASPQSCPDACVPANPRNAYVGLVAPKYSKHSKIVPPQKIDFTLVGGRVTGVQEGLREIGIEVTRNRAVHALISCNCSIENAIDQICEEVDRERDDDSISSAEPEQIRGGASSLSGRDDDSDSDSCVGPEIIQGGAEQGGTLGDDAANLLLDFSRASKVYSVHRFVTSEPGPLGMQISLQQLSVLVNSVKPNTTASFLGVKKEDVITRVTHPLETTDPKQMHDALISDSNRPLTFEVKRQHMLGTTKVPKALHRFVIWEEGLVGVRLHNNQKNLCVVLRVEPGSLAEVYGMMPNDVLARPDTDGKVIVSSSCPLPFYFGLLSCSPPMSCTYFLVLFPDNHEGL